MLNLLEKHTRWSHALRVDIAQIVGEQERDLRDPVNMSSLTMFQREGMMAPELIDDLNAALGPDNKSTPFTSQQSSAIENEMIHFSGHSKLLVELRRNPQRVQGVSTRKNWIESSTKCCRESSLRYISGWYRIRQRHIVKHIFQIHRDCGIQFSIQEIVALHPRPKGSELGRTFFFMIVFARHALPSPRFKRLVTNIFLTRIKSMSTRPGSKGETRYPIPSSYVANFFIKCPRQALKISRNQKKAQRKFENEEWNNL